MLHGRLWFFWAGNRQGSLTSRHTTEVPWYRQSVHWGPFPQPHQRTLALLACNMRALESRTHDSPLVKEHSCVEHLALSVLCWEMFSLLFVYCWWETIAFIQTVGTLSNHGSWRPVDTSDENVYGVGQKQGRLLPWQHHLAWCWSCILGHLPHTSVSLLDPHYECWF